MAVQECIYSGGGGTKTYELYGQPPAARIECGFAPRIIMVFDSEYGKNFSAGHRMALYWDKKTPTTFNQQYDGTATTPSATSGTEQFANINSTGFNLVYAQNYSSSAYIVVLE